MCLRAGPNQDTFISPFYFFFMHRIFFSVFVFVSDAQIPDGLRPVYSDLKEAEAFWINYYRGIPGYQFEYPAVSSARPPLERTTRDTPRPPKGVTPKGGPDSSTPWHIPTNWKSNNGKIYRVNSNSA